MKARQIEEEMLFGSKPAVTPSKKRVATNSATPLKSASKVRKVFEIQISRPNYRLIVDNFVCFMHVVRVLYACCSLWLLAFLVACTAFVCPSLLSFTLKPTKR